MAEGYTDEELFRAAQAADAAGDTEAARKLTQALLEGKTQDQIETMAANLGQVIDAKNKQVLAENIASRDAGGPVGGFVEVPPAHASGAAPMQVAGKSIANTLTGYLQGAGEAVIDFPLTIGALPQVGLNSLLGGVEAFSYDALGMGQLADDSRAKTDQINERLLNNAKPVNNLFNALAPPPAGYETQRDVARFAGGFLVPGPKGAKPPIAAPGAAPAARSVPGLIDNAAAVVVEGRARNVPVMTTDIKPPASGMGRMLKQTVPEKIPLVGMSGPRAAQQEARVQAVRDFVDEFGGDSARSLVDTNIMEDIARTLGQARSDRIGKLKRAKDAVIQGVTAPFTSAPNASRAIDEQIAKLQGIDDQAYAPVIERLSRFKEQLTAGKSLEQVEGQRRLLGEMFNDANLSAIKTDGQKAINAIYDPLRRDMGDFIEAQAGAGARNRWAKSNEQLTAMAGELKSSRFRAVLRDADTTPEAVGRILFSGSDNVSDMQRLVTNLPPAGRKKVQAALIQRAFDSAGGRDGVSVERFLNGLKNNSQKLGVAFEGQDRQTLEGVRRLLEATRRGGESVANVRTGEQNLPTVLGVGATQTLGLAGGTATLGVGGLVARIYESPVMRDRLLRLASTRPGSVAESRALEALMRSAAPIVTQWQEALPKAINDNPANLVAASESQQPE